MIQEILYNTGLKLLIHPYIIRSKAYSMVTIVIEIFINN